MKLPGPGEPWSDAQIIHNLQQVSMEKDVKIMNLMQQVKELKARIKQLVRAHNMNARPENQIPD